MNILVLIPASKKHKAELEGAAPDAEFAYSSIEAATDKQVASADVIVGNLPAARLHTKRQPLVAFGRFGWHMGRR